MDFLNNHHLTYFVGFRRGRNGKGKSGENAGAKDEESVELKHHPRAEATVLRCTGGDHGACRVPLLPVEGLMMIFRS